MIEYILEDGTPIGVEPENEEQFKLDNPTAKLKSNEPGKQESSANEENVNVEQIDGTSQSQDNQQDKGTELASEDGSSEQLEINRSDLENKYQQIYGWGSSMDNLSTEDLQFYVDNPFASKPKDDEQEIDEPILQLSANGPHYTDKEGKTINKKDLNENQLDELTKTGTSIIQTAADLAEDQPWIDDLEPDEWGVKYRDPNLTDKINENQKRFEEKTEGKNYIDNPEYVDISHYVPPDKLETLLDGGGLNETKKYIDSNGDGIPDKRALDKKEWAFYHKYDKTMDQVKTEVDEFNNSMPKFSDSTHRGGKDIMRMDEGPAVKALRKLYKDWTDSEGRKFTFDQAKWGITGRDHVRITAPNGATQVWAIDTYSKSKRDDHRKEMEEFIRVHSMPEDLKIADYDVDRETIIDAAIEDAKKEAKIDTKAHIEDQETTDAKIKDLEYQIEQEKKSIVGADQEKIEALTRSIQILKGIDPSVFTDESADVPWREALVKDKDGNIKYEHLFKLYKDNIQAGGKNMVINPLEGIGGEHPGMMTVDIIKDLFNDEEIDKVKSSSPRMLFSMFLQARAINNYIIDKKKNDPLFKPNKGTFTQLRNELLDGTNTELVNYLDKEIDNERWWREQKNIWNRQLENNEITQEEYDEFFKEDSKSINSFYDYETRVTKSTESDYNRAKVDEVLRKKYLDKTGGEREAYQEIAAGFENADQQSAHRLKWQQQELLHKEGARLEKEIILLNQESEKAEKTIKEEQDNYDIKYTDVIDEKTGEKTGEKKIDTSHITNGIESIYKKNEVDNKKEFDKNIQNIISEAPTMEQQEQGAKKIEKKYYPQGQPTQEDVNKVFESIKSKHDLTTKKGAAAAQKEWNDYQNEMLENEKLYKEEYNNYIKTNTKKINNTNLKLKEYQDKQKKLREKSIKEAEKFKNEELEKIDSYYKKILPHINVLKNTGKKWESIRKAQLDLGDLAFEYQDKLSYLYNKASISGQFLDEEMRTMDPRSWTNIRNSIVDFFIRGVGDVGEFLHDTQAKDYKKKDGDPTILASLRENIESESTEAVCDIIGIGEEGRTWIDRIKWLATGARNIKDEIGPQIFFSNDGLLASINEKTGKNQSLWRKLRGNWKEGAMEHAAKRTRRTRDIDDLWEMEGGTWKNMDHWGEWMGEGAVQNLPVIATIMASGGYAIPIIMAQGTGTKFGQLKDEIDLYYETGGLYGMQHNFGDMVTNALITGVSEGAFEYVTAGIWGRTIKQIGLAGGKKVFKDITGKTIKAIKKGNPEEIIKRGFVNELKRMMSPMNLGKNGIILAGESGMESVAEGLTQFTENLADIWILGKTDIHWSDNLDASAIQGAGIASMLQSPRALSVIIKPFQAMQTSIDNRQRLERLDSITKQLDKLKHSDGGFIEKNKDEAERLTKEYARIVEDIVKTIEYDIKRVDVLPDSQKKILLEIEKRNWQDNKEIEKIRGDNTLSKEERTKKLDEIYKKFDSRQARKENILKQYTPNIVDKHYKNRIDTIKAMMEQAKEYGAPIVSIVEMGTKKYKEAVKRYELDQRNSTEKDIEEVISQNEYLIEGLQDIINDPKSTKKEIEDAEAELKVVQKQVRLKNILNTSTYGAMQPIMGKNKKGQTVITEMKLLVNKDAVIKDGMFNTAAHEFIHAVWANTLKFDPGLRKILGGQVKKILEGDGVIMSESTRLEFNKRVRGYETDLQGEEALAIASEMMMDGRIKLNDGPIQKFRDHFRRFAQEHIGWPIRFNSTNDVRNFLKDYHRSIEKNKPNRAIAKMLAKGANGKIFKDKRTNKEIKAEQTFSNAIRKNLESNPDLKEEFDNLVQNEDGSPKHTDNADFKDSPEYTEGYYKIMDSKLLDGLIRQGITELGLPPDALGDFTRQVKEKIAERYLTNFNLDKNDSLFGWLTGISGGAGKSIIYRAKGDVMKQYVKEGKAKETSIDKVIGDQGTLADVIKDEKDILIDKIENADMSPAARNELSNDIKGLKMVMDLLGFPKNVKKAVTDAVIEANVPITIMTDGIQVQDLTYKNIKDLLLDTEGKVTTEKRTIPTGPLFGVLNAIAAEFGVDPLRILAKQDLNAEQRRAAQMFILNKSLNSDGTFNKDIIEALPEGQDRSGKSTGVANTKLGQFYIKGERAKMKAGATAAGLATQTKRTNITKNEFLDLFGINPDGSFQPGTKADGAIRELIVQIAQLSANQSIRVEAVKNQVESADAVARLADGTSKAMYSDNVEGRNEIQEETLFIIESTKLTPAKIFQEIGISDPLAAIKALNKGEFVWTGKLKDQAIEVIQEYIKRDPSLYYVFRDSMAFGINRSTFGLTKIFESLAPEGNFEKIFNRFEYKDSRKKIKRKGKDVKNKNYGKLNKAKIFKKDGKFYFKLVGGEVVSYKEFVEIQESTQEALFNIFDVTLDLGPTKSWFLKYFVGDSSSNMNGLIRTSARLIGVPINPDGSIDYNTPIREEHMFPQNNVGRILTRSFLIAKGNPFIAMKIIKAAYAQMPLRMEPKGSGNNFKDGNLNDHDGMVEAAGYATSMPDFFWDVIAPRIADGSLDYLPPGLVSIVRYTKSDIDLNGYQLFNGQTITEFFGVNVDNFYDLSKEEQIKIVKEQNRRIEEILAGNKEIKVAKKEIKVEAKNSVKRMEDKNLSSFSNKFDKNKIEINNKINLQIQKRKLDNSMSNKGLFKIQGMSVFDFDDTLGYTKSGVRVIMPNIDGKPKPKRKVIFLAGGAGSGKGNVIKKLGLEKQGFKIVNQDISLEWLKKNSGLPADMRDLTKEQRSTLGKLGAQARKIARRKMMKYQGEGNGVIVDGTGGSTKQMQKLVDEFKSKGYDVSMLFVDTSLDVALERNRARKERSLLDVMVRKNHESVQNNKDTFKEVFGDRFMEVNTDNLTQESAMPPSLVEQVNDFVSSYEKRRIDAAEFASQGDQLLREGAEFDFTEFDQVVEGTPGPLLSKALERAKKYGTKDIFVLTARTQKSAEAIQQFLKSQGLNIPIENITGLANSTSDAKAQWFLKKFAEGYNDMYFTDDALQNVEAVQEVLSQLDVKSDVVQAKAGKVNRIIDTSNSMESKIVEPDSNDPNKRDPIDKEFNDMIERKKGVDSETIISEAEGKKRGSQPNLIRFLKSLYIPPSAEDFKGLMYYFVGKGKQGDADLKWFKEKLFDPFAKGIRSWNAYKQNMINEYKALKKKFPKVIKSLNKKIPGTVFTNDTAIRVYLFDKAGHDIPGIPESQKQQLIDHINSNPELKAFADGLSTITRSKDGYPAPTENWVVSSIPGDMNNLVNKIGRKDFLQEWTNMKNIIFSKENLNKIEATYGKWFREALDNILYRMENGGNRTTSPDSTVNRFTEWINGSVGAIMFFNMRSALLQTISTVNFINWSDNNIFKAAAAFANQPQFWKDFAMLFNSDQLKQRRRGLQTDVSASELQKTFAEGKATPRAVINY